MITAGFMACCYIVLNHTGRKENKISFYEKRVKQIIDKLLSFGGLIILAPVFGIIAFAIFIDDPGPVLFTQKRVGQGKQLFLLHKFRSMKMCTPHNVPTHQLERPEQYITRVGKFLRKTSLDELPQIWDIFRGKMSIIGPRPALWNQNDLVAERDKYGANDVLPGLTGWAQINGRDELEIAEKARLDGEYVRHLRQGGMRALFFDVRCFLGTIVSVLGSKGVVEGGTGELNRTEEKASAYRRTGIARAQINGESAKEKRKETISAADAGSADYGYLKHFDIDTSKNNKKRVLITGAGSYIGESYEAWAKKYYTANFVIDTVDMQNSDWKKKDFSDYDAIFHVAGIAHADVGKVSEEEKKKYYAVNTDLAIETAKKAKAEGVKQFIFMSSMIIYGDSAPYGEEKVIDEYTIPAPVNFYGDSKWQADKGVRGLADEAFHVAVLRPPMIYGKGSRGNYPVLVNLAKNLPAFPDVENRRSMLYIGNLCEFLCKLMLSGESGIYFPQNGEYTRTSEMVRQIAETAGKRIWVTKLLNPAVMIGSHMPGKIAGLVNKAFGNCAYRQKLSEYEGLEYQHIDLKTSVAYTEDFEYQKPELEKGASEIRCNKDTETDIEESRQKDSAIYQDSKKKVLILVNHDVVIYNFRLELVERLLDEEYEVHISSPYGERIDDLVKIGAKYHKIDIDRHGMNPKADMQVFCEYWRLIKRICPMVILTYTIKPNVYGGIAAQMAHIPFIANVTGLGTTLNQGGMKERLILFLYRLGLRGAQKIFFQNRSNMKFMLDKHVISALCSTEVLPGSGVNLNVHNFEPYPEETDRLIFATIGRIMCDKGTDELLYAAEKIKEKYPAVTFRLIGFFDEDYEEKIRKAEKKGIIEYVEQQRDVHPWMKEAHAIIHPSYHEGMSNVLLEAAATGRPVLASDIPGCREAFEEGVSGIGFRPRNGIGLTKTIEKFICLPYAKKIAMGVAGRTRMEKKFDRNIVVDKYMKEIHEISSLSDKRK